MKPVVLAVCVILSACNTFSSLTGDTGSDSSTADTDRDARTDVSVPDGGANNVNNVNNINDTSLDTLGDSSQDAAIDMSTYDPLCPPIIAANNPISYDTTPDNDATMSVLIAFPMPLFVNIAVSGPNRWVTLVDSLPAERMSFYLWRDPQGMLHPPEFANPGNWTPERVPTGFISHNLGSIPVFVLTGEFSGAMNLWAQAFTTTNMPTAIGPQPVPWTSKQLENGRSGDFAFEPAVAGGLVDGTPETYWTMAVIDEGGRQSIGRAREDEITFETFTLPNDTFGTRKLLSTHGQSVFSWNESTLAVERLSFDNGATTFADTTFTSRVQPAVAYLGDDCGAGIYAVAHSVSPANGYELQTYPHARTAVVVNTDNVSHLRAQAIVPNTDPDSYNTVVVANIEPDDANMAMMAAFRVFSVGQESVDLLACRRRLLFQTMSSTDVGDFSFDARVLNGTLENHVVWTNDTTMETYVFQLDFPNLGRNERQGLMEARDPDCQDVFF